MPDRFRLAAIDNDSLVYAQSAPPLTFIAGVSVLVLLFCLEFSALPAALTAFRDPVSVLRTA